MAGALLDGPVQRLGDDDGIGQHGIDPMADPGCERLDIFGGRRLPEGDGQHIAVEA